MLPCLCALISDAVNDEHARCTVQQMLILSTSTKKSDTEPDDAAMSHGQQLSEKLEVESKETPATSPPASGSTAPGEAPAGRRERSTKVASIPFHKAFRVTEQVIAAAGKPRQLSCLSAC